VRSDGLAGLGEEGVEVEGAGVHGDVAGGGAGPLGGGEVAVELEAVAVGVFEVEGLADAVVGGAGEGDAGVAEAAEGVGEGGSVGVEDREVVEAGGAGGRRPTAPALPGVQADVVVVAAAGRGEEDGLGAHALDDVEAEDAVVEGEGAFEVGDAEVDVADADGAGHGGWYGRGAEIGAADGRVCSGGAGAAAVEALVSAGGEGGREKGGGDQWQSGWALLPLSV